MKVSRSQYIFDMYEREYLYFSLHKSFRGKNPEQKGILDPREMNVSTWHPDYLSIIFKSTKQEFKFTKGKNIIDPEVNEAGDNDLNTLICSFYWLNNELEDPNALYQRGFYIEGNQMLVINKPVEFCKTIYTSLRSLNLFFEGDHVKYYDPKTWNGPRGSLTTHHKDIAFSYQNEFRIAIRPSNYGEPGILPSLPMEIPIPGLKQMSYINDIYPPIG
ncbi:MAG TPA: hypothetical protein PKL70_11600 [Saprospiraceae bacterium]|nr:hypothetical protein [Saprospiraceae bacterium]